jgi:1-acyl-sn-glycerol-3-phosphate acyltransferase
MIFDIFVAEKEAKHFPDTVSELGFRLIKAYVRLFHDKIYYRKVYSINNANIPDNGALMIVANHQNSLCDPLGIIMSVRNRQHRKLKVVARADAFNKSLINRIARFLGLVPAYRLSHEGFENLTNNSTSFNEIEQELLNDGTIVIYPEAGHQDKRWLGKFSYGYLRILFDAAEKSNFEKEMFVLPSCNHYSNYFGLQGELLIKYGTPISLAPFYELYKTKPRTAQRQVNALVREQVESLMLNITDLENYAAIDYLRETYGVKYAENNNLDPNKLPEKLLSDKQLFAELERIKEHHKTELKEIYDKTSRLEKEEKKLNINDYSFEKKHSNLEMFVNGFLITMFLPLFIFSLLPNIFIFLFPKSINKKIEDRMMHNTINIAVSMLITIPISCILIFFILYILSNSLLLSLAFVAILPFLGMYVCYYAKAVKKWVRQVNFNKLYKSGKLAELIELRSDIHQSLDNLLK